jgi:hypothetical protein
MPVPKALLGVLKDPFELPPAPQVEPQGPQPEQAPQIQQDPFAPLDDPEYKGLPEKPKYTFEWGGSLPGYDVAPPEEQRKWEQIFGPPQPEPVTELPEQPWRSVIPKEVSKAIFAPTMEETEKGMSLAEGISAEPIAVEAKAAPISKAPTYELDITKPEVVAGFTPDERQEAALRMRESSNRQQAENEPGYLGYHQAGAEALSDLKLVDKKAWRAWTKVHGKGNASHKAFLNQPKHWTGEAKSKQEFLDNPKLQQQAFHEYQDQIETYLRSDEHVAPGLTKGSSREEVMGWKAAAHLVGMGSIKQAIHYAPGTSFPRDGNDVSGRTYYAISALAQQGKTAPSAPAWDKLAEEYWQDQYRIGEVRDSGLRKVLTDIAVNFSEGTIQKIIAKYTGVKSATGEVTTGQIRALEQVPNLTKKLREYYMSTRKKHTTSKGKVWYSWPKNRKPTLPSIPRTFMRHGGAGE